MKEIKIRNWFNQRLAKSPGEIRTTPSQTVPDDVMSVREILHRYTHGLPINGAKVPIYRGEDDDLPDLSHMDLADREMYMDQYQDELRELTEKLKRVDPNMQIKLVKNSEDVETKLSGQ